MIKNLSTTYVPGERKNKWLKLKPEYIDGIGDDLDLVILGGYYGTGIGKRAGTISHFLLGVSVFDSNEDESYYITRTPKT
jgi:DNA ligase-4